MQKPPDLSGASLNFSKVPLIRSFVETLLRADQNAASIEVVAYYPSLGSARFGPLAVVTSKAQHQKVS